MTSNLMEEIEVQKIPIPSQSPRPLDLSHLPDHILRSSAVEALANQNEDLMARLSVALRRSSLLEEKISELDKENKSLTHKLNITQDQILVLQEKDRRLSQKAAQHDGQLNSALEQIQLLETRYAELYLSGKERTQDLTQKIQHLGRRLARHLRYRQRLSRVHQSLRRNLATQKSQKIQAEENAKNLMTRLGEAGERIQFLAKNHEVHQRQLVENYENTLKELNEKLKLSQQNCERLEAQSKNHETLLDKNIELENKLIAEERQGSEYRHRTQQELEELQTQLTHFRTESKTQTLQIKTLTDERQTLQTEDEAHRQQILKLTDQVETLQLLWQEGQTTQEKLTNKNQSLQKLNQQLSTTVLQHRHEAATLRQQLEAQTLSTVERIKEIKASLQMLDPASLLSVATDANSLPLTEAQRLIDRLDKLISQLHSLRYQNPVASTLSSTTNEDRFTEGSSSPL